MLNSKNLLTLKAPKSNLEVGADFARDSFNSNFSEYLRRFKEANVDRWSLYAILDVQPGRFSFAQISGRDELNLEGQPRIQTSLLPEDIERTPKLRRLTEAMAEEISQVVRIGSSVAARDEFGRLVDTDEIKRCVRSDGLFDLPAWIGLQAQKSQPHTDFFAGHPYIGENRKSLLRIVRDAGVLRRDSP